MLDGWTARYLILWEKEKNPRARTCRIKWQQIKSNLHPSSSFHHSRYTATASNLCRSALGQTTFNDDNYHSYDDNDNDNDNDDDDDNNNRNDNSCVDIRLFDGRQSFT